MAINNTFYKIISYSISWDTISFQCLFSIWDWNCVSLYRQGCLWREHREHTQETLLGNCAVHNGLRLYTAIQIISHRHAHGPVWSWGLLIKTASLVILGSEWKLTSTCTEIQNVFQIVKKDEHQWKRPENMSGGIYSLFLCPTYHPCELSEAEVTTVEVSTAPIDCVFKLPPATSFVLLNGIRFLLLARWDMLMM